MSKFITIEGIEGVGKSTQCERLGNWISDHHHGEVCLTREPGGTRLGEALRSILIDPEIPAMHQKSELLLMFAARAEHIEAVIKPALTAGTWVICDRFTDATYAYQGGGRGIDESEIARLEDYVQQSLRPNLTIVLDIDVVEGLQRAKSRGTTDRFEQEEISFFERVRENYLNRAKADPHRCVVIDGSQSVDHVSASIQAAVTEKLF